MHLYCYRTILYLPYRTCMTHCTIPLPYHAPVLYQHHTCTTGRTIFIPYHAPVPCNKTLLYLHDRRYTGGYKPKVLSAHEHVSRVHQGRELAHGTRPPQLLLPPASHFVTGETPGNWVPSLLTHKCMLLRTLGYPFNTRGQMPHLMKIPGGTSVW
jgi:hypothetical protein